MDEIAGGVTVFIIFLGMSSPIIVVGLVYYFLKRLEHKRIIAAIEKGVPISELGIDPKEQDKKSEGPGWVRDQSKGITLLIIGLGIGFVLWGLGGQGFGPIGMGLHMWVFWIIPIVFLGNAIGLIVRSRMRRKYEKPERVELSENNTDQSDDNIAIQ